MKENIIKHQFPGVLVAIVLGFFLPQPLLATDSNKKSNVIFILVDDLGWKDLGCQGSLFYRTPNIDQLAGSGMRFTDAYASCPVCSPTRASIMTGKYPARLNITDWIPGLDPKNRKLLGTQDLHQLPLSEITIAETFQSNGYKTFFAGKWHLGDNGYFPEDQGFDINKGGHHKGSPPGGYYTPYKNPKLEDGPEGEYLPDRLTDESIRFLEENREDPFFLFLSFYTVHTPIQPCERLIEENNKRAALLQYSDPSSIKERNGITKLWQDNADYASMIQALDENIGRLLGKLDELNLADNTIVVFTSDNGGLSTLRSAGSPTSNAPLRAGKGWCYEGGIRVPLIIRASGVTSPGSTCNSPVSSIDFYPTILELAGLTPLVNQDIDGLSLASLLKGGKTLKREAIYWHFPHYHGSTWAPGAAVRAGNWKLIEFYEEEKFELFNLKTDIGEKNDLSKIYPQEAKELLNMLHLWQWELGAKMPEPNPDFSGK
ncbi:MAG: sulfatase [Bacteroidota bacterium]|nr:sulfatase [Bacteroidota bacterium]